MVYIPPYTPPANPGLMGGAGAAPKPNGLIWGSGGRSGGSGGGSAAKPAGGGGGALSAAAQGYGKVKNGGAGGGGGNPLVDMMLGLLGGGGGGGSYYGGYDGTAARNAANAAYQQQLGNTKKVYGQITGDVKGRAPLIQASYADATAQINADAQARAAADAQRGAEADLRNQQTAGALGLHTVQPTDTQADELQQAGTNAYQANAQAWTGFNDASSKTALERNTATADAFQYAGAQTETSLAQMLQQALAQIAGQEAANPGGYSGGGGSSSSDVRILSELMDYDLAQQKLAGGGGNALSSLSPSAWQAIAGAYGNVSSLGLGGAQQQSLVLKNLANNPQDFATLFSYYNS